ncbi:hypothetical protein [Hymenobacter profundi]|uniref:Auto-transporter adhesin head GIN domain-containing protein n=1 Tax=Hymenobacter profundi TaxID=1982110 RepID=A0ABS6X3T2_9BACT|nr:hypothetical protein [Hymenobacter profundi]MBW3130494.1 hypothetical protein [Hymenobacter profundi]
MHYLRLTFLLLTYLFTSQPGWAQQVPVAPIVPRTPAAQSAAPTIRQAAPAADSARRKPEAVAHQPEHPIAESLIILNNNLIINGLLTEVNPNEIETLVIYKGADAPLELRSLTANGIIDISLKKKNSFKAKSLKLSDIGKRLLLSGPISYSVNGMPVAEADLRIASAAIGNIKITATSDTATMVDVQTTSMGLKRVPPDPPGTIRIRGVASH